MDNRAGEMDVFVRVIELGSFSAAGRRLKMTPSAVSKLVARLENRLGTRLLVRSTRQLRPTPEGEIYLERARRVLTEIEAAEDAVAGGGLVPRGRLRINSLVGFGTVHLMPLVPEFLARHPHVTLDLSLSDSMIDVVEDRADIAFRSGPMRDSSLKSRRLLVSPRVVVAAPSYLARHGVPERPRDLAAHNCLTFNFRRSVDAWAFRDPATGEALDLDVGGNFQGNSGLVVREMCIAGLGIARLGRFHVAADIAAGRLVPLLEDHNGGDAEVVHAVFPEHRHLSARIRAFLDFLAERIAATPERP